MLVKILIDDALRLNLNEGKVEKKNILVEAILSCPASRWPIN
jgi:hypothetical protein